ncbi:MAG: double zinc ribbon domain-containing protein [Arenicellales bacterium WSBS_2016_MAG_OTU3]
MFPLIKNLANSIFPKYCDLCQRLQTDTADTPPGLCLPCRGKLARNHSPCKICAAPETGGANPICGRCQRELSNGQSYLDQTFARYLYKNGIAELIQGFKYNRKLYLASTFSRLLESVKNAAGIEESLPRQL